MRDHRHHVASSMSMFSSRGKNPWHRNEARPPFDAVGPATNRRVIFVGNSAFVRQHDVREAGDVRYRRRICCRDPLLPVLLREPKVFIKDSKQPMSACAAFFYVVLEPERHM